MGSLPKLLRYKKQQQLFLSLNRQYHMKCLQIESYAPAVKDLKATFNAPCPSHTQLKSDEALVKVHAASINPFDIEMSRGYGRSALNLVRQYSKSPEFPLILGRDCSGIIVKRGKRFRRFKEGDPVYCVRWIVGQGTHAEYVIVNKSEASYKPNSISHIEAASIPYVACTTWSALINSGAVPVTGRTKLRIFIPGGTGGIGSFAAQLCQSYGHDVITSCATDGVELLNNISLNNVLDYTSPVFENDLKSAGPYDIILDTLDERYAGLYKSVLKQRPTSKYVSLRPSLLLDMDKQGVFLGMLKSGGKYLKSSVTQLSSGQGVYQWGFFDPNALILNRITPLIEDGKIRPLVDKVFSINNILDGYEYLENGHARGKTIIQMVSS